MPAEWHDADLVWHEIYPDSEAAGKAQLADRYLGFQPHWLDRVLAFGRFNDIINRFITDDDVDLTDDEFVMTVFARYLKSRAEPIIDVTE